LIAASAKAKLAFPECDEIFNFFADQAKSPDDDFVTRAAREYALNKIRERLKQSIERTSRRYGGDGERMPEI
jgi:hypothetical protein